MKTYKTLIQEDYVIPPVKTRRKIAKHALILEHDLDIFLDWAFKNISRIEELSELEIEAWYLYLLAVNLGYAEGIKCTVSNIGELLSKK